MQYKAQIMRSRDIRRPFIALTSTAFSLPVTNILSMCMRLRRCGVELHYIGDCFGGRTPSLHLLATAKMRWKLGLNSCYKTVLVPWCNSA